MTVVREPLGPPAHKPEDARRDVRRAWVSLALLPVAFALATLVGEGLLAVQGYGNAGVGTVSASSAARGLPGQAGAGISRRSDLALRKVLHG